MIKQLMTESREKLKWWKKRIIDAVGHNGGVVAELIPEIEWILGKQAIPNQLPPKEAENRFFMVFTEFIKVFAWKGHPLVLFLDDLQWMDNASAKLLKYLYQDGNLSSVLIVGAYRENEIDENHPVNEILENIGEDQSNIIHIPLMPFLYTETEKFVLDTLNIEEVSDLSEDLYRKSGGNPLFLKQLLVHLYDEGLIRFDLKEGNWHWDIESIRRLQPGEDVLEIILKKLQRLPKETYEAIKLASCIGNRFDLQTLSAVFGKSLQETSSSLMIAVKEGLLLIVESKNDWLLSEYGELENTSFEFLHDKIQQTLYSSIPEKEKKEKHAEIGLLLLEKYSPSGIEDRILFIMDHISRGIDLIYEQEKRIKLAEYNLMAGRKAKAATAYQSALKYFRTGKELYHIFRPWLTNQPLD